MAATGPIGGKRIGVVGKSVEKCGLCWRSVAGGKRIKQELKMWANMWRWWITPR